MMAYLLPYSKDIAIEMGGILNGRIGSNTGALPWRATAVRIETPQITAIGGSAGIDAQCEASRAELSVKSPASPAMVSGDTA